MQQVICRHILCWVEENLETGADILALALLTGYCRRTLELWFSAVYEISLGKYLFRRRMTRAAVLLRLSILPITEIAILLHYSSNQNFSRAFRRFSGKTPTEYRNSEAWDLSVLQASFLYTLNKRVKMNIRFMPKMYLNGELYACQHSFHTNADDSFLYKLKRSVTNLINDGVKDVYFTSRVFTSKHLKLNREGRIDVRGYIGVQVEVNDENTIILPGGKFCCYKITCLWDDYYPSTNSHLIEIMSENKLKLTCREFYVHYTEDKETINKYVTCRFFIPIE